MTMIICMLLLGSALVVAEVMFPSFGLLGLMAAGAYVLAVVRGFEIGDRTGYVIIACIVVAVPGAIFSGIQALKHTSLGNRILLQAPAHAAVTAGAADGRLAGLVGAEGVAATALRPSGFVEIGDDRVDAVSAGSFMEPGTRVRVTYVEGNRVVVEPTADATEGNA